MSFSVGASTVLSAIYAWAPIQSKDDPIVARINASIHRMVCAAAPGAHLVEIIPIMKHLPSWMAKWKREGLEWHRKDSIMFSDFMEGVRKTVVRCVSITSPINDCHPDYTGFQQRGDYQPSFAATLIEKNRRYALTNKESAWLAGAML